MASTPILISGTVTDSSGDLLTNAIVKFTFGNAFEIAETNSSGQYIFDLNNIGVTIGDTVTYESYDEFNNEVFNSTFVAAETQTINIILTLRTKNNRINVPGNRDTQIFNIGGKPVSKENPFQIITSKIPKGEGSMTITYDASDNPITLVKVIGEDTYTRNIIYDGNNNPTSISKWVKT